MLSHRFLALAILILASCKNAKKPKAAPQTVQNELENANLCDSVSKCLRSGDLVFRLGNDITSYMLSQLNQNDKSFSHCGIVSIENGSPFIYHAIGGEYNPDQKIKREAPKQWFSPKNNLMVAVSRLDLDSNKTRKLVETVQTYYKEGKKFDMEFDLNTDDRLYCAEMIYKSIQHAAADSNFIPTTAAFGKKYVGIDDLFRNVHASFICRVRYK